MTSYLTLSTLILLGGTLPEETQRELFALLSPRCKQATKDKLARRLAMPLSLWPNWHQFTRIQVSSSGVSYCASTHYATELAHVRKLILQG